MRVPDVEGSTKEERLEVVKNKFRCISDCDSCGLCKVFRGRDPMVVYQDYIDGNCSFQEISGRLREE